MQYKIQDRYTIPVFTAIILKDGDKTCLLKRSNTKYLNNKYVFAGGGVDGQESITQATIREAAEELGVKLQAENLKIAHVLHAKTPTEDEYINFFMETTKWEGEPRVTEPEKSSNVAWFSINQLPVDITPLHKHVIDMIDKKIMYSEVNWK